MTLRLACAWCGAELQAGDPNAPTSHGICQRCADDIRMPVKSPVPASDGSARRVGS